MAFAEDQDVIQAVAPERSDQALSIRVLQGSDGGVHEELAPKRGKDYPGRNRDEDARPMTAQIAAVLRH
jgi:hypothetical protein